MKTWFICIDDTDDIGTKGTGEIAEEIAQKLESFGLGTASPVTRHQLFVHPDIPYTSHNSAMCFTLTGEATLEAIRSLAIAHLVAESADVADPGLAVGRVSEHAKAALTQFGLEAKEQVKTKQQAYDLAATTGIYLSEHGGTGQGVIGAIAGLGLRLTGRDGRMKGQVSVAGSVSKELPEVQMSVSQFLSQSSVDGVMTFDGEALLGSETLILSGKLKAIFQQHQFVLPVYQQDGLWRNATRSQLKAF